MERVTICLPDNPAYVNEDSVQLSDEFGAKCYIGDAVDRLAAYEDTGLTPEEIADHEEMFKAYRHVCGGKSPEEINKIISGVPTKVSFDIGDNGFLFAINAAFKERYGVTADEFEGIIAKRDTLKKALELACDNLSELEYCYGYKQKACEADVPTACIECLSSHYIQQAQEQERKKL